MELQCQHFEGYRLTVLVLLLRIISFVTECPTFYTVELVSSQGKQVAVCVAQTKRIISAYLINLEIKASFPSQF